MSFLLKIYGFALLLTLSSLLNVNATHLWSNLLRPPAQQLNKIIIDVDPGIDDIEALVLLLNAHNKKLLEIAAIVVSEGNTEQKYGIENTYKLLMAANRLEIPVYAGAALPILPHGEKLENFFGTDGFGDLQVDLPAPTQLLQRVIATSAIRRIVEQFPKQVTYIALGPMTNLALCMRMYHGFAQQLKQIYAMGGLINGDKGEFNILFDPEAAEIVFSMLASPMTLFTWQACVTDAPMRVWFENATIANPVFDMVLMAEESLKAMHPEDPQWISCDPNTIVAYLQPASIVNSYEAPLIVELAQGQDRGKITNYEATPTTKRNPVRVITEIDYKMAENVFLLAFDEICRARQCH